MKNKKQITHWLSVIVIGITLGFALQFVRAWTEPTTAPPGGNVGAPINTSGNTQTKDGGLNVMGSLGIGTGSPANKLDVVGKVKASGDICTTVTGSEICLSTVSGTPGDPGDPGNPTYDCGNDICEAGEDLYSCVHDCCFCPSIASGALPVARCGDKYDADPAGPGGVGIWYECRYDGYWYYNGGRIY